MTRSGAESRLVAEIRAKLGKRGWYAWKNHGNQYAQAGLPDIMAVKDGQLLCIEAKVGNNKPTKIQQVTLDRLASHGALTTVAYSWSDVESALQIAQATSGNNLEHSKAGVDELPASDPVIEAPSHLRERRITSFEDLQVAVANRSCFVRWLRGHQQYQTADGRVIKAEKTQSGREIMLVEHWSTEWYRFDPEFFCIYTIR